MKKYDERDTIFARMGYLEGSKAYEAYYRKYPEKKEIDDQLRRMPQLLSEGTATFDHLRGPIADANFIFMNDIMNLVTPKVNPQKQKVDSRVITKIIKGLLIHYGAGSVGIAKMSDEMYYSHRGRREHIGQAIDDSMKHSFGIVFTIPMDLEMIKRAPGLPEVTEVSNAYLKGAIIGMQLSYYIAALGYSVRNHMDANYLVIAPRVAYEAGLGEFGRNGLLITPKYGPNVRLGVVTTDLLLETDQPINFGVKHYCKVCKKCVRTCPGKAISNSDDEKDWQNLHESCYMRWRSLGTDCGICLSNCPFTWQVADVDDIEGSLQAYEKLYGIRPYEKEGPEWFKSNKA